MSLAVIGVGSMGEALVSGWLAAGWEADDIVFVQRSDERAQIIEQRHGIRRVTLAEAGQAEIVVLGVKPFQVVDVVAELAEHLAPSTLVLSVAAGVTMDTLAAQLPDGQPLARVMPNTPSLVRQGMASVSMGEHTTAADQERVVALMGAVGRAVVVDEDAIHAVIGVAGSAPAFLFYVAEALIEAGVQQGLTRPQATVMVNQTFSGAAAMLQDSGESATTLREQVTSPGGTTAQGLRELDERGVRAAFMATVEAAARKSRSMS